jgi:diguanylate cyclase (GGDEF)-like protein/PAS domain S-box-containing protein
MSLDGLPSVESLYPLIAANIADIVLLTTPDNTYRWASPSTTRILGRDPEDFVGRSLADFVLPDTYERVHFARTHHSNGFTQVDQFQMRKGDGTYLWVRGSSYELYDGKENLVGRVVSMYDVETEVQAQEKLNISEHRYRLLAENTQDVVVLKNASTLEWVSPSVKFLLGFDPEEVVGRPYDDFIDPAMVDRLHAAIDGLALGESTSLMVRMVRNDKSLRWVATSLKKAKSFAHDKEPWHIIATWHDAQSEVEAHEKLVELSTHDPLTGLANRNLLSDTLREILVNSMKKSRITGIMMIDIDHFKTVNDQFGHEGGDEFLRETARRLKASVRAKDLVARVGGDEFAIVLSDIENIQEARSMAARIMELFRAPFLFGTAQAEVLKTVSIGMAVGNFREVESLERKADSALYAAKEAGRNQLVEYSDN